jgi:PadR family transcriptional regulator, regulatory protein PadR
MDHTCLLMKRVYLGEFEEIVLLVVAVLNGTAYGVNIAHEIFSQTGREVRLNQVHSALVRLEEKGMISSRMGEPTAERGGRRKRMVAITAFGTHTLHEIQQLRSALWSSVPSEIKSATA